MINKEDPRFCPVKNDLCPQGIEKAKECRFRFEIDFDPIRNIRDFDIFCCSYQKTLDGKNNSNDL
jgi:hypothetical protein